MLLVLAMIVIMAAVSLAAIKALHQKLNEKDAQIADLEKRIEQLEALMLSSANR